MADKIEKLLQGVDRFVEVEKQKQTSLLRDRFTEKEDPLMQVKSEIAKSNEILQKMLEKDKEGVVGGSGIGLGVIGSIGKSLIGGLTGFFGGAGAAGLFAGIGTALVGGIGVALVSAFTGRNLIKLAKSIADTINSQRESDEIGKVVTESQEESLKKSLHVRKLKGEITPERSQELVSENERLNRLERAAVTRKKVEGMDLVPDGLIGEFIDAGIISKWDSYFALSQEALWKKISERLHQRRQEWVQDIKEVDNDIIDLLYEAAKARGESGLVKTDNLSFSKPVSEIPYFIEHGRTQGQEMLPEILDKYGEYIKNASTEYGIPEELIAAMIAQESSGNANAVSKAGAGGLMQLMPATAKEMGVTDVFDPEQNIMGGSKYIAQQLINQTGDTETALMSYNAGPRRIRNFLSGTGEPLKDETLEYAPGVLYKMSIAKDLLGRNLSEKSVVTQNDTANLPSKATDEDTFVNKIVDGFKSALEVMAKSLAPQIGKEVANNIPKPKQTSVNYNPSID